ncbi:MAG: hypothetical protein NTX13_06160 [Acidobacteria bacterium]|nr:hypothetical protein [Acidobacteriota bacterium]
MVLRHPETLQSLRPARTAGHEYLHLLVKHSQLSLPLSRNEGLAELYSTIDEFGGKIRIGNPIPAHLYQLRTGWLPLKNVLKNVLAVGHDSAEHNKREHAGLFYAGLFY